LPQTRGVLALFEITYADGGRETYNIPVLADSDDAAIRDAMEEPGFCRALLTHIRAGSSLPAREGVFRFTPTHSWRGAWRMRRFHVSRVAVEQSNTSVAYDDRAVLKLFRRLDGGPNPDHEIADFLTRATAFRGIPRLLGSIAYERQGRSRRPWRSSRSSCESRRRVDHHVRAPR